MSHSERRATSHIPSDAKGRRPSGRLGKAPARSGGLGETGAFRRLGPVRTVGVRHPMGVMPVFDESI